MKTKLWVPAVALAVIVAVPLFGGSGGSGGGGAIVTAATDLQWKEMNSAGVAAATVAGDMEKGPSRFFLRYPAGLVTPKHHHNADHYGTLVSGTITLVAGGKEQRLGPGSYFSLTGGESHLTRVEGSEAAVFYIQADGPWDVVME